ncbi:hypothetical protein [Aestuariibacter salexigens]|uniref:hypothetical protein n=1 Tax=Aestuariibacter salexigens TaxID=226010 RepID=UPI0004181A3D|nr:hypothetical protein [Aestuariibacter salexigens]
MPDSNKLSSEKPVGESVQSCPLKGRFNFIVNCEVPSDISQLPEENKANYTLNISLKNTQTQEIIKHKMKLMCPVCADTSELLMMGLYEITAEPDKRSDYSTPAMQMSFCPPANGVTTVTINLQRIKLIEFTPGKDLKAFINLTDREKGTLKDNEQPGREVKVSAKINRPVAGKKIFFKFVPKSTGTPEITDNAHKAKLAVVGGKSTQIEQEIVESETNAEGIAEATFTTSRYGGDKFKLFASLNESFTKNDSKSSGIITVWRKLWYQLNYHKDLSSKLPSMTTAVNNLKDAFIELEAEKDVLHTLEKISHPKWNKPKTLVGIHNQADYHALRKSNYEDKSVHIVFADEVYHGYDVTIDVKGILDSSTGLVTLDDDEEIPFEFFSPPLQKGKKLFVSGTWKCVNDTNVNGSFTDEPNKVNDKIGLVKYHSEQFLEVSLPKLAMASKKNPVNVIIEVTPAVGPLLGDASTPPHNLINVSTSIKEIMETIIHELGHNINMTPHTDHCESPAGFTLSHSKLYSKTGPHCWSGGKKVGDEFKEDGTCVMFHAGTPKCTSQFCHECMPYVLAQDLTKFRKNKAKDDK